MIISPHYFSWVSKMKAEQLEKKQIVKYISKYCKNLKTNEDKNTFDIGSEKELKELIYGIEQRYYTTEIGNEKRLANSVIKL
jgi:hypothetical protein